MGIIAAIATPVLFSGLSRLQNDEKEFQQLFLRFEKIVGLMIIPMGVGIYIFRDFVTTLILGDQWTEASGFIGLWALMSALAIVLAHFSSEVYRAKGQPKLSVLAQMLHIIVLWPVVLYFVREGFESLYVARSLVRLELIVVQLCIMRIALKMPVGKMITNILPICLAALGMLLVLLLPTPEGIIMNILYIMIASLIYFFIILLFREERKTLLHLPYLIKNK